MPMTAGQHDWLRAAGSDAARGGLFGRLMTPAALADWLSARAGASR
jgi:sensor c-di-GMP phosphodiesterase-like protein